VSVVGILPPLFVLVAIDPALLQGRIMHEYAVARYSLQANAAHYKNTTIDPIAKAAFGSDRTLIRQMSPSPIWS
jgi:hypothetical protein